MYGLSPQTLHCSWRANISQRFGAVAGAIVAQELGACQLVSRAQNGGKVAVGLPWNVLRKRANGFNRRWAFRSLECLIMCGRTVWHLPIGPGIVKHCPSNLEQNAMLAVFNRAGYDTMRTCKNGNSYEAANKLFAVRHDASKLGGTEETGSAWHAEQVLNNLYDRETRVIGN